jgi:alpha-1,6-mannosyltransferase
MSPAWRRRHSLSLVLLTIAGVIFRSELAVLVATQTAYLVLSSRASLTKVVIPAGLFGLALGLLLTVSVDSHFWQQTPIWPEWSSFYYNTILGKASDWGTSPWHFYFTSAIPKLLMNPLSSMVFIPLAMLNPATSERAQSIIGPEMAFVALYSILPHKEWRFIVYIIPGMTAVSAMGAAWIWNRRSKSLSYQALNLLMLASVAGSFLASGSLLAISRLNYPGGQAMSRLHDLTGSSNRTFTIFADNLACQTGVTRFLEARGETIDGNPKYRFDKTENQTALLDPLFWKDFDYALVEHPERCIGKWEAVDVITAFSGIQIVRPGGVIGPETTTEHLFLDDKKENWQAWNDLGEVMRRKMTKGWWITLHMEPKIKILKRQS